MRNNDHMNALYPSAVLGYRVWTYEELSLMPLFYRDDAWHPGINLACCHRHRWHQHRAVGSCNCGFHAYHQLSKAGDARACSPLDLPTVIGMVAGCGEIQVHADGWRASEAQVLGLYRHQPGAEGLAKIYQVPLFSDPRELSQILAGKVVPAPATLIPPGPRKNRLL